jgi:hypothetical protein
MAGSSSVHIYRFHLFSNDATSPVSALIDRSAASVSWCVQKVSGIFDPKVVPPSWDISKETEACMSCVDINGPW